MFTVINGVLLKPLPYADPARLVAVHGRAETLKVFGPVVWKDQQLLRVGEGTGFPFPPIRDSCCGMVDVMTWYMPRIRLLYGNHSASAANTCPQTLQRSRSISKTVASSGDCPTIILVGVGTPSRGVPLLSIVSLAAKA